MLQSIKSHSRCLILQAASIEPKGIAIAVDGTVVRKTDYNSFTLADGNEILVIQAFYGG